MKSVIEVKGLSKVYKIGHERQAATGTGTIRDAISGLARKPLELITGHRLEQEQFWALKDLNFTVGQGDVLGIIGRNGSGKSTLLKVLSRIVEPTAGTVKMRGKVASLLEVGTGFHPELTGRENIYFNGAILGMSRREIKRKFDEIVEFSEVEQFLDTPVKFYSSGMYVRLAFAVAAHLEPDILIVDEVLAVGDAAFQKKSLGKMSSVAKEGRTVLFVSHNMPTVQKLCTTGIHMVKGQIKTLGPIKDAVDSYLNVHLNAEPQFKIENSAAVAAGAGYASEIEFLTREGKPSSTVPFGKAFRVRINFTLNQNSEDLVVGVGLKNNLEVAVWTTWADRQKLSAGSYSADFLFDGVTLESGMYNVIVGLSEADKNFYQNDTGAFFNITAFDAFDPRILQSSGAGIVLNPTKVVVTQLPQCAKK